MTDGGDLPRRGADLKGRIGAFPRSMVAAGHTTSLPVETNSISIDPTTKDAWGIPAMRVTYKDHPDDPAASVVDKFHRTHDVPNLFLCDGSSFVTSGRGQPTMTIQAPA
jgi:hypothetical protein